MITSWIIAISSIISALAAFVAAIVLILYTFYTRQMHKELKNQTSELIHQKRLSILPSLLLYVNMDDQVFLTNMGNGVAIKINVTPTTISGRENLPSAIDFKELPFLKPNETKEIIHNGKDVRFEQLFSKLVEQKKTAW